MKARDEAITAAVNAGSSVAADKTSGLPGKLSPKTIPDFDQLSEAKASVAGTFSGEVLGGFGAGSSVEEKLDKQEQHLARIAENTDRQNSALERVERNMNQGIMLS